MLKEAFYQKYKESTIQLVERFDNIQTKSWDIEHFLIELSIQLGHLSLSLKLSDDNALIYRNIQETFRNTNNIGDELSDVIMQLFSIENKLNLQCLLSFDEQENVNEKHLLFTMIILAGQIQDAYLRINKTKQSLDRSCSEDWLLLSKKMAHIFDLCFQLAGKYDIDLFIYYDKMLLDANKYVDSLSFCKDGRYSTVEKHNNIIRKEIELIISAHDSNIISKLRDYYEELMDCDFIIPKTIFWLDNEKKLILDQTYIRGARLDHYIDNMAHNICNIDSQANLIDVFSKVCSGIVHLYNKKPYIRIDSNITNFIVCDSDITLVDVFPPIFLADYCEKETASYYDRLCVDIKYQLHAFFYYYIRELIRHTQTKDYTLMFNILKVLRQLFDAFCIQVCVSKKNNDFSLEQYKPFSCKINEIYEILQNKQYEKLEKIFDWSFTKMLDEEWIHD